MRDRALNEIRAYRNTFNYVSEIKIRVQKAQTIDELIDLRLEMKKYGDPLPGAIREVVKMIDRRLTKIQKEQ
jgi:hypothetical protein